MMFAWISLAVIGGIILGALVIILLVAIATRDAVGRGLNL